MLRVLCAVGLDGWSSLGVTESQMRQTSWGRSIGGVYDMPETAKTARWGFAMLESWLGGLGHTGEAQHT